MTPRQNPTTGESPVMQAGAQIIEFPVERVNPLILRIIGQTALVLILPVVRIEWCDADG